jgi:hypothetical protein
VASPPLCVLALQRASRFVVGEPQEKLAVLVPVLQGVAQRTFEIGGRVDVRRDMARLALVLA